MSGATGVGAAASALLYAVVSNPAQVGAQPEDAKAKKHHLKHGRGFENPWDSFISYSVPRVLGGMTWRRITGKQNIPDTTPPTVTVVKPTFIESRDIKTLRATWLGHACFYVEFPGGLRVLFDPVFEKCCSPIAFKSLERYTPPPCEIEDLPPIDLVVISHNHYDHLSYPTIKRIQKKDPNCHFFAPLGNKKWFEDCGISNATELDWWDTRDVKLEVKGKEGEGTISGVVGALPCQHVTARGPFDKCKTLWASWSVESGGAKVYSAG